MLIFHEGLPGSGKSYEAISRRVIPALKEGRGCTVYVEGIDHEKIAGLVGIPVELCREKLQVLSREQVPEIHKLARDNDLIVLDEAQNFWGNRDRLPKDLTEFVTEHRHRGMDIVLMGQDIRDVQALWRRRIEIKACFLKLSAIGASKSYSVTTYRHLGGDQFEKVGVVMHKYDPQYFGTYASHTNTDVSTVDYKDARATVLNAPWIRYVMPLVIGLALWGAWKSWKFFHPEQVAKPPTAVAAAPGATGTASAPQRQADAKDKPVSQAKVSVQEAHFVEISGKYRIRLAGLISIKGRADGVVEWVDGTRIADRMSFEELRQLGVSLVVSQSVVRLYLGEWQAMATMWPMGEAPGAATQAQLQALKDQAAAEQHGPYIYIPKLAVKESKGEDMAVGKKPI